MTNPSSSRPWMDYFGVAKDSPHPYLDMFSNAIHAAAKSIDEHTTVPIANGIQSASHYVWNHTPQPVKDAINSEQQYIQKNWSDRQKAKMPDAVRAAMNFVPTLVSSAGGLATALGTAISRPAESVSDLAKLGLSGAAYSGDKALNLSGINPLPYELQRYLEAPGRAAGTEMTKDFRDSKGNLSSSATYNSLINNPGGLALNGVLAATPAGDILGGVSKGAEALRGLTAAKAGQVGDLAVNGSRAANIASGVQGAAEALKPVTSAAQKGAEAISNFGKNYGPMRPVNAAASAVKNAVSPTLSSLAGNTVFRGRNPANGFRGDLSKADAPINDQHALTGATRPEGLSPSDRIAANPDLANSVESVVSQKGFSPQAVAEGEGAYHGVNLTRDQLNGTARNTATVAQDARIASDKLAASASEKAGGPESALVNQAGGNLIDAAKRSHSARESAYDNLSKIGGEFDSQRFFHTLGQGMQDALGGPSEIEKIRINPALTDTKKALNYIDDMGNIDAPLTLDGVNGMRRTLNELIGEGGATDENFVGKIKSSLTDTSQNLIKTGGFNGDAEAADGAIQNASDLNKFHMEHFGPRGTYGGPIRSLGSDAKDIVERGANPTDEQVSKVGTSLANGVASPNLETISVDALNKARTVDPNLADSLERVARARTANGLKNGASGADTLNAIGSFRDILGPEDAAHLASAADLDNFVNLPIKKSFPIKSRLAAVGSHVADSLAGGALGSALGPLGAAAGVVAGDSFARAQDKADAAQSAAINATGSAPNLNLTARASQGAQNVADAVKGPAQYAPVAASAVAASHSKGEPTTEAEALAQGYVPVDDQTPKTDAEARAMGYVPVEEHAAGGRTAFASGGRANVNPHTVDRLVNKLMKRLKATKKETSKMTEPLLNHSDESIARALSIAAKGI